MECLKAWRCGDGAGEIDAPRRSASSPWLLLRRLSGAGEPLHRGERAIDICRWRKAADRRCNNAVRRDDKGRAFRKTVADFDTARVLEAMFLGINLKVIGVRDLAIRVGRNRNLSGAVQRVRGKRVQMVDIVQRHADHRRTRSLKLFHLHSELMGLDIAALGESRRIKVHDDRPVAPRIREREGEGLSGERCLSREFGSRVTLLQGRKCGQGDSRCQENSNYRAFHVNTPTTASDHRRRRVCVAPASNRTPACGRGSVYGSSASVATLYSSSCTKSAALL